MIAKVNIEAGFKNGKTYLKNCFFNTPFKIANITESRGDSSLKLMMMSSSPGILDGDQYEIKIQLDEDASLELQTQSYQRLFNMKVGASQKMTVTMQPNSSFCFLPHPTVPHKGSRFRAQNKIHLSKGCAVIWGEVFTCGRRLNGEEFAFSRYQNITEFLLDGKLVVKENLVLDPLLTHFQSLGQFEGYTHQASFIYISQAANTSFLVSEINRLLSLYPDICFGVSALPVKGIVVRLFGGKGEQLYAILKIIAEFIVISTAAAIEIGAVQTVGDHAN